MDFAHGIEDFIARTLACYPDDTATADVATQRQRYRAMCQAFARPRPAEVETAGFALPASEPGRRIPARLYRPRGAGDLPLVVYLHGGGFVVGDLDSHDGITAALCARGGFAVLAVDYRLAPEHRAPSALLDGWDAWRHALEHPADFGARGVPAVCGDSAGGTLAAALCLLARQRGAPQPAAQALFYPALAADETLPAYQHKADAPLLSRADVAYYRRVVLAPGQAPGAFEAPLLAADVAGLAPAWVAVAEHDPLHDDGVCYVERLRTAGVATELYRGHGLVHGCLRAYATSPAVRALLDTAATWLGTRLGDREAGADVSFF